MKMTGRIPFHHISITGLMKGARDRRGSTNPMQLDHLVGEMTGISWTGDKAVGEKRNILATV
jgi:hypothetical protein